MLIQRPFLSMLALPQALAARTAPAFTPPGPNVALGKNYTLEPTPNYRRRIDEGDLVQI